MHGGKSPQLSEEEPDGQQALIWQIGNVVFEQSMRAVGSGGNEGQSGSLLSVQSINVGIQHSALCVGIGLYVSQGGISAAHTTPASCGQQCCGQSGRVLSAQFINSGIQHSM